MFEKNLYLIVKEESIYSLVDKVNGRGGHGMRALQYSHSSYLLFSSKWDPMLQA
jgi:hypothetical protein